MQGAHGHRQPPPPDNDDLESLISSLDSKKGSGGLVVEQTRFFNPVTGTWEVRRRRRGTRWDSRRRCLVDIDDDQPLTCWAGDILDEGQTVISCSNCGNLSCARHSILDPRCGRAFCTSCTRSIVIDGTHIRVCHDCFLRLRSTWWRRFIELLFGSR